MPIAPVPHLVGQSVPALSSERRSAGWHYTERHWLARNAARCVKLLRIGAIVGNQAHPTNNHCSAWWPLASSCKRDRFLVGDGDAIGDKSTGGAPKRRAQAPLRATTNTSTNSTEFDRGLDPLGRVLRQEPDHDRAGRRARGLNLRCVPRRHRGLWRSPAARFRRPSAALRQRRLFHEPSLLTRCRRPGARLAVVDVCRFLPARRPARITRIHAVRYRDVSS